MSSSCLGTSGGSRSAYVCARSLTAARIGHCSPKGQRSFRLMTRLRAPAQAAYSGRDARREPRELMPRSAGADPRRRIPPVDEVLRAPALADLCARHGRPLVVRYVRARLEEIRAASVSPDDGSLEAQLSTLPGQVEQRLRAGTASLARPRHQRHRRGHPHQPGPGSPAARGGRAAWRRWPRPTRTSSSTSRPASAASARCTPRPGSSGCWAAPRPRSCQQQRRGGAAGRQHVRRRARGAREPRRAGGDRRLVPRARRGGQGGRAPAGGRHHQPHAAGRLRGGPGPADRAHPQGPPQQLPHRRVHGHAVARGAGGASRSDAGLPLVEDLGSGLLERLPGPLAGEPTVPDALAGGRRRGHLERRQADGRPAGRPDRRPARPRGRDAAQPALPRAARRQDDAGRARRRAGRARGRTRRGRAARAADAARGRGGGPRARRDARRLPARRDRRGRDRRRARRVRGRRRRAADGRAPDGARGRPASRGEPRTASPTTCAPGSPPWWHASPTGGSSSTSARCCRARRTSCGRRWFGSCASTSLCTPATAAPVASSDRRCDVLPFSSSPSSP